MCQAFEDVAVLPDDDPILRHFPSSCPETAFGFVQIALSTYLCACGDKHTRLTAQTCATIDTPICLVLSAQPVVRDEPFLLLQSDGSFRKKGSQHAAGCGVIGWIVHHNAQRPVVFAQQGVPDGVSSMDAEAAGLLLSATLFQQSRIQWLTENNLLNIKVVFQLDNLPIVNYMNGLARSTNTAVSLLLEQAKALLSYSPTLLTFEYIPRESNQWADFAAGSASDELLLHRLAPSEPYSDSSQVVFLPCPGVAPGNLTCFKHGSPQIFFWEIPDPVLHLVPSLLHGKCDFAKAVHTYCRALSLGRFPGAGLHVCYSLRGGSRYYSNAPAAQTLPKKGRLFLFGLSHSEMDLIAAQFTIFLVATTGTPTYRGMTAFDLRLFIQSLLASTPLEREHPGCAKELLNRFINTSAAIAISFVMKTNFFVHPFISATLHELDRSRHRLFAFAAQRGYVDISTEARNKHYYAMEFLEARYVTVIANHLLHHGQVESLIWLHDGLWVKPEPSAELLFQAAQVASSSIDIPLIGLKITSLSISWLQHFEHLTSTTNCNTVNSRNRREAARLSISKSTPHLHSKGMHTLVTRKHFTCVISKYFTKKSLL